MSTPTKTSRRSRAASSSDSTTKRRPGRPRKSETEAAGAKNNKAARQSRLAAKRAGTSTRELIIARANEIINQTGVVDLRIETLAQSLGLSPGNITYHFPKKEDIISAIWEEYSSMMRDVTEEIITPLLDIKQMYLYFRTAAAKAINYVGVTAYYFGDMGALIRENETFRTQIQHARELIFAGYDTLAQNGYMVPITDPQLKELTFNAQMTMLRWWINHALTKCPQSELGTVMDRYIALSLLQLLPYLTESGRRQFTHVINLLK